MRTGMSLAVITSVICLMTIASTPGAVRADSTLVSLGSTWKYLDDGSDQGTAWSGTSFVDTTWAEGPAQLGYGDGDEATVVSYGPEPLNKYITTYFRHEFDVVDPSDFACLKLLVLRDDGAVVYLNGAEIERSNMPDTSIAYRTPAASTVGGTGETTLQRSFTLPNDLAAGTNVIAVEIHQVSATSSDISFDLQLEGLTDMPTLIHKVPYLIYTGNNTGMDVHWQLILTDTCSIEWGLNTSYSMGSAETYEYGSDHQHTYTISGLTPGTRYHYRVSVQGEQYAGYFRTAPADDETSVKFFAYGDTRTYPADHDAVAAAMVSKFLAEPDFRTFVLSVGDLVTDGNDETDWKDEFFNPFYPNIRKMLARLPYQAAMGNHEGSGVLFTRYFPYPFVAGRYWSFDYGPAHFTVVDQYTSYSPGSDQLDWIEADLAATTKPWKFIYLHEPGWSAGGHGNDTNVQNYIQPLCETYGVAMVLAGHNHYYARAVVNGIQHITTGGGGAPLYDPNPASPNVVASAKVHHFCTLEIDGGLLHFEAVTPAGAIVDSLTLSLPGAGNMPAGDESRLEASDLSPAEPNPFGTYTSVPFSVGQESHVLLEVYDVGGRRVRTLIENVMPAGSYTSVWDGADDAGRPLPSGIYFFRLRVPERFVTRKAVLMR